MYVQQLTGDWEQQAQKRWSNLTEEDLAMVGGECERLVDAVQKRYGLAREEAELQVDQFCRATASAHEEPDVEECETGNPSGTCKSSPPRRQQSRMPTDRAGPQSEVPTIRRSDGEE